MPQIMKNGVCLAVAIVVVSVLAGACTVQSDELNVGDLSDTYLGPAVCAKLSECSPTLFASLYPAGQSACLEKVRSGYSASQRAELSGCTNGDGEACHRDYMALACPADASPASCNKCKVSK